MKRYIVFIDGANGGHYLKEYEDFRGEWVKYEDVKKLEELNRKMVKVLEQAEIFLRNNAPYWDSFRREIVEVLQKARNEGICRGEGE